MGVQGLWRLLESTGKPVNPETLEGKILAVDISIWLNQAVKGVRDREGNSVQNAHLLTLFNRVCKLLFFRIKPVFVFDGDAPLLKKQTLALRRQRKEELSRESKQTNEKLLKTFLKRQAIKAALGDRSKDPLPSISDVRRDEVDDIYVLPALPPAEEKDKNSSEEEEEQEREEMTETYLMYQEELYERPNSVDINSEEFTSLPPEMKHEILKDMKEFSKRRRTMYHKPPEQSGDFSQYQLAGLLQRNHLNKRLEEVEREMGQQSAGWAPQNFGEDGDQGEHSVESRRVLSEDSSHYILIKGSKKSEKAPESQPAAQPWSGGPLSRSRRDRPEPLWRPVIEEDEEQGPSSAPKPSILKPPLSPQRNADPPSPRTLKAIQAAMDDSSDEEMSGSVSPRTRLAIQQALSEDDNGMSEREALIVRAPNESLPTSRHPAPRLIISSSEDEKEADDLQCINLQHTENKSDQNVHTRNRLLDSSSEDELDEAIGQRNSVAVLPHSDGHPNREETQNEREASMESEEQTKRKTLVHVGSGGEKDRKEHKERGVLEYEWTGEDMGHDQKDSSGQSQRVASDQKDMSMTLSPRLLQEPLNARPLPSHSRSDDSIEALEERHGTVPKKEDNEGSDSEESFIEVSEEEELTEKDDDDRAGDSRIQDKGPPADVHEEEYKEEEEEPLSSPADGLQGGEEEENSMEEVNEDRERDSSSTPVTNEWEHIDAEELEALESSLQVQQSSLKEQKQQQERMAATVTGQMCLESQELLRLFGVPYVVAPMEAEAQCAALDRSDHTHGTITDDSDVWLFGGRHVYKNFFSQNKYVEHYQYIDLQNQLGLDRSKLINLAYLLGSDYTEGIPGVGYVTGMEILNEFPGPSMEPLTNFSEWWSEAQKNKRLVSDPRDSKVKKKLQALKLQPGFPNPVVAQAYLHPAVEQSDSSFSWGFPDIHLIKEFCQSRFGWNSRRAEETLQPVLKQLNVHQTQLRIDSFFRMEQQERQAIRSQRLRRAVTCLKRKEREGGGMEEEDEKCDEEEMISPSKLRKGKSGEQKKTVGGEKERDTAGSVTGGGFLGSAVSGEQKKTVGGEKERDTAGSVMGGGFLGSAPPVNAESPLGSLKDVTSGSDDMESTSITHKHILQPKSLPKITGQSNSSSSDEDSDGGSDIPMVTARSVFEDKWRGHGGRGRGRGRGKGKGRVKKL